MSLLTAVRMGKSHDADHFGTYEISSGASVLEEGVPGAYEVVLLSRRDLRAIACTVSGADGSYAFRYLSDATAEGYVLVAFDHGASPVSPAISDTPALTPMVFDF